MEKIKIYYGVQGNGMTFNLMPSVRENLQKAFAKSQPPIRIFVEYDMRSNFAEYHAQLENYIFPALMGFSHPDDLKKINWVEFIKTPEMKVTHTIEQNLKTNDPEVQSISR
jgi:hypothetical protein